MMWFKFRFNSSQEKINENLREHPINDWAEEKIKDCINTANRCSLILEPDFFGFPESILDPEIRIYYQDLRTLSLLEAKALRQYYDS